MRILFVTASWLPDSIGGVELHLFGIARALRRDHEVRVFTRTARPDLEEFSILEDAVESIPVSRLAYRFSDCDGFPRVYKNPAIREKFERELARFRPDVVHAHHLTCLSTDLLDAARDFGARTVMTLHDFWMGCPRGQRMTPDLELCHDIDLTRCLPCLTRMWSGWFGIGRHGPDVPEEQRRERDLKMLREYHEWIRGVLGRVDRLVTPSWSSARIFARQGVPIERIRVVENGLDAAPFERARRARAKRGPGDRFRFGYIGSVIPTKGVHVLIDAFSRLGREDAELEIHGDAFPWHEIRGYDERLRASAAPLRERVRFSGRYEASELPAILGELDALVIPSLWFEAFCLTLREGYLAGVPVIASDLGAMREGAVDGETALLFRPGDADHLARQMGRLMDDESLRRRLVESKKTVRSVEENAAELLACYA